MTDARISVNLWRALVALFALVVGVAFLREPGLGDDIDYWGLGFRLREEGGSAWTKNFHDLRWPIWGVCWVLQGMLGYGLMSYYGEPLVYLVAGALLIHHLARLLFRSEQTALLAAVLFVFHPLLDGAVTRPMPDLSEGFCAAAAFAAWLHLMRAESRRTAVLFAALTGLALAVGYANRITGVFTIPVLVVATLALYRQRMLWLMLAGVFAAAFVAVEALIYWRVTGDFLHSLHANLGARGRKGTEPLALWKLPLRFLDPIWTGTFLKVMYALLATVGGVWLWRNAERQGRAVVLWLVLYYLAFSCAVQGFDPVRPLVRDGERFIASLAFPMSLLTAGGFVLGLELLKRRGVTLRIQPAVAAVVLLGALLAGTRREFFNLGFVPEMRRYMATVPEGARVLASAPMMEVAHLVDAKRAGSLQWTVRKKLLLATPEIEEAARAAEQIWYNRKFLWVSTRKEMEREEHEEAPAFGSFFVAPESEGWMLREVISRGGNPDFVFFGKGEANRTTLSMPGVELPLRLEFARGTKAKMTSPRVPVPEALRGRRVMVQVRASANTVEAVSARVFFYSGEKVVGDYTLKPYLFPRTGLEFFAVEVPAEAEAFVLDLRIQKGAQWVVLDAVELVTGVE